MTTNAREEREPATRTLGGSEILPLDEPGPIWLVESGSLALFVLSHGGGPRRFLFTVGVGQAVFPLPSDGGRPIIAVALEPTRLRRAGTSPGAAEPDGLSAAWAAAWAATLGLPREALAPAAAGSLEPFHRQVLERIDAQARDEATAELARVRARAVRSRQAVRDAVVELAGVGSAAPPGVPAGSDLFVAAALVAQAQGVTLRPAPAGKERIERADSVESICRASHVRSRQVLLHDGWWREDCGPILGFDGPARVPVALLPAGAGRYEVLDPTTRRRAPVDASTAASLQPHGYVFYRPLPTAAGRAAGLVRFALRGCGRDLTLVLATAAALTLLGMLTPQATALLVDHAIPGADTGLLAQLGLGLLAAAIGGALFHYAQGIAILRLETAADAATQSAVWDRVLNLQLAFFRRFATGDLESRVTAVSQIRGYLSGTTLRTLFSSVVLLLNLGLLLYYSPRLTLVALAVAALSAALTVASGAAILRCSRDVLERRGRFLGLMVQLIHGVPKLRVAAAEERAFARWARDYAELVRLEVRRGRLQDGVRLLNGALSSVGTIVLFAAAASLALLAPGADGNAGLTPGVFLAFNVAYGTFVGAVAGLSNTATDVMAVAILRERARPILEAVPEIHAHKADPGVLQGRLDVDHVSFRYREEGPVVLDGVSLHAEAGQFVALVGPSGSGKSTLLRLLLGFEAPQSGTILYDGQELSGLDVQAVRRQMGVVLQNGRINAGSLFDNITCGTPRTLGEAWEAARATGFAEEITAWPMGMHTIIGEGGTNLSGGQRQRLLLTRALVHRPRILLLDEATSALDNRTQSVISASLRALRVTRVVIAHRLSTIREAHRIYVIDGGRVVQAGGFAELAASPGLFARLVARQLG
jgi:ATP-binding cassette subfamily C protein